MATVVVYVEQEGGKPVRASLECLGAARSTGHAVVAVVAREGADNAAKDLGRFGAGKVVCLAGSARYSPDASPRSPETRRAYLGASAAGRSARRYSTS